MAIKKTSLKTAVVVSSGLYSFLMVALPGEAATFATSTGSFSFGDFSQLPASVSTSTDTDTVSSGDGSIITDATASAFFNQNPAFSLNMVVSEALGEGANYLGIAESEASVLGQFEILENTNFEFAFVGLLDLFTAIDDPVTEQAQATGGITFALLDEAATVLTSFEIFGTLDTPSDGDELFVDSTPNLDWTIDDAVFFSGPNELVETASIVVSGEYSQSFDESQLLTLVEFKTSETFISREPVGQPPVQTPEPGILLSLASLGGVAFSLRRAKDQAV